MTSVMQAMTPPPSFSEVRNFYTNFSRLPRHQSEFQLSMFPKVASQYWATIEIQDVIHCFIS